MRIVILHILLMFLKLIREKRVVNLSSYFDVSKIMMKMRGNDLTGQIYSYLKMDSQHWSMINLLD